MGVPNDCLGGGGSIKEEDTAGVGEVGGGGEGADGSDAGEGDGEGGGPGEAELDEAGVELLQLRGRGEVQIRCLFGGSDGGVHVFARRRQRWNLEGRECQ